MSCHKDVLCEIPDEKLPKLSSLYEKNASLAPHVISLIQTGILWKKSAKFRKWVTFLSPENSWEKDGTVIVVQSNYCYTIFIFTLSEDYTNLRRALTQTKLLKYRNGTFFNVHEKHIPVVTQVLEDLKLEGRRSEVPYYMYALPPSLNRTIPKCPSGVYVTKLTLGSAEQINTAWPHNFEGSVKYIESLIVSLGGYGVFLESTNELVAWILRYSLGHVGLLQVEDLWKKRGYGTLVTQFLVGEIVGEGFWPFATISANNVASRSLFEKLGFRKIGQCTYFSLL